MTLDPTDGTSTVPMPARTVVAGQDGSTLLTIDGVLILPLGARIELGGDIGDVSVVGMRLVDADLGSPSLVLDVDAGGSSFDPAALRQAAAEMEVVEAAEEITTGGAPTEGDPAEGAPTEV